MHTHEREKRATSQLPEVGGRHDKHSSHPSHPEQTLTLTLPSVICGDVSSAVFRSLYLSMHAVVQSCVRWRGHTARAQCDAHQQQSVVRTAAAGSSNKCTRGRLQRRLLPRPGTHPGGAASGQRVRRRGGAQLRVTHTKTRRVRSRRWPASQRQASRRRVATQAGGAHTPSRPCVVRSA
jgi:hypothetical protein